MCFQHMTDDAGKRGQHDEQAGGDQHQLMARERGAVAEQDATRTEQLDQAERQQQGADAVQDQQSQWNA